MKHDLAEGLSTRRAAQLASFLDCHARGKLPQCRMINSRGAGTPVARTANGAVLPFIIFSQGIKRDGDDLIIRGGRLDNFRENPRMLWAHSQKLDPVGNWIPETIRASSDPKYGEIISGHARPLSLDDGSDTARRSATVFRMLELRDITSISGSWDSEDVELIRNTAGRIKGIRHKIWEALEGSVVLIGSDPAAQMRLVRGLQERDGLVDDRDREFFSRVLDDARGGDAGPYIIRDVGIDETPEDLPASVAAARIARAVASLGGDPDEIAAAEERFVAALERRGVTVHDRGATGEGEDAEDGADADWHWNRALSRALDIATVQLEPATRELALVSAYLDTEVKLIEEGGCAIPAARMGAFLTGLDDQIAAWNVEDVRCLRYDASERPPVHKVLQLNSTLRRDFLVDGARFMSRRDGGQRIVLQIEPSYRGMQLTTWVRREDAEHARALVAGAWARAASYRFLRGEVFRLSGDFLTPTDETWDDCFLAADNERAIKRRVQRLIDGGAQTDNQGMIIAGPPGTGKSLFGRVITNTTRGVKTGVGGDPITSIVVEARDFGYGGTWAIPEAFALARENAPCILRFEDVDNSLTPEAVDLFKSEMDGAEQSRGILTILVSNHPERMPEALIDRPGRFHEVLHVDLPNAEQRAKMVARWMPDLDAAAASAAVTATDGYTGAHVREYAKFAASIAKEENITLAEALTRASAKLLEQRATIDKLQSQGTAYRPRRALAEALATTRLAGPMTTRAMVAQTPERRAIEAPHKLTRFRAAFAPIVGALMGGTLTPEVISRAVSTLAETEDLADIEQALQSTIESVKQIRSTTLSALEDHADDPSAEPHARVAKVLAARNRRRLEQIRNLATEVLEDDQPTDTAGSEGEGALASDTERMTPDLEAQMVRLASAVEELEMGRSAQSILDELRHAPQNVRMRRALDTLALPVTPAA